MENIRMELTTMKKLEVKNSLDVINNRLDISQEKISKFEDIIIKII